MRFHLPYISVSKDPNNRMNGFLDSGDYEYGTCEHHIWWFATPVLGFRLEIGFQLPRICL